MGKWSFREEHDIMVAHIKRLEEERKAKEEAERSECEKKL